MTDIQPTNGTEYAVSSNVTISANVSDPYYNSLDSVQANVTWDSTYDAYCDRCVRFVHSDSVFRDWSHILGERGRLWREKREKWMNEARKKEEMNKDMRGRI